MCVCVGSKSQKVREKMELSERLKEKAKVELNETDENRDESIQQLQVKLYSVVPEALALTQVYKL